VWNASRTEGTGSNKSHEQQPALALFAIGMIGFGMLAVVYHDFAYGWQPVPEFHPGREALAVVCGLFMMALGVALLLPATVAIAARVLLPFLLVWLSLKLPRVLTHPEIEGVWVSFGEIGTLLAAAWVLFARLSDLESSPSPLLRFLTGPRAIRIAQILFGLAIIPIGLGHLFYPKITTILVPPWLPFREGLALLTGVGQIVCGLAIVFAVFPRLAALTETAMVTLFAFLVWGPDSWFANTVKMAGTPPGSRFPLTAFLITWLVGAAALLIANNSAGSLTPLRKPLLSARLPTRREDRSQEQRP
jgi:uncharacterized membrane protein